MYCLRFLLGLGLLLCCSVAWGQDTHQVLPSTGEPITFNPRLQNFLTHEPAARTADAGARSDWVVSGCLADSSASRVLSPFACAAYTRNGHYAVQASTGIDLAAVGGPACATTDLAWVIITDGLGAPGGNFVQIGGSQYYVDCFSPQQPGTPDNAALLFVARITGGAAAVRDLRRLAPTLPSRNNAHGVDTVAAEQAAWWGDSAQPYVIPASGCTHATSGTTTSTILACRAYVLDVGPPRRLLYVEEAGTQDITYTQGDGTYWLLLHADVAGLAPDWNRVEGTHYLTRFAAAHPTNIPNRAILLAQVTVLGGAITVVDSTVADSGPYNFDKAVYPTQYGMKCDGVTENSPALVAAHDALPPTGGTIQLPASRFPCKFGTTFAPTKPVHLTGVGGAATNKVINPAETTLEYTGSGRAMNFEGAQTNGSVIENFKLNHSGTAQIGIRLEGGNHSLIRGVSITAPTVPFSIAAIQLTETSGHSHTLEHNSLLTAAPIGLKIGGGIGLVILNNSIKHHSDCNIQLGDPQNTRDIHILFNKLENNNVGHTAAWSICAVGASSIWIDGNHFELGQGADGVMKTTSADRRCEHCVFANNQVNMLNTTPMADGLFFFDAPGNIPEVYFFMHHNRIQDNRVAPPTTYLVELGNTSGDGGAALVSIKDNQVDTSVSLVNEPAYIKLLYDHSNNYFLTEIRDGTNRNLCIEHVGVGNTGTGEDNLMPACSVLHNRLRRDGIGLAMVFAGEFSAANETKQLRVYVDGVLVWDSGAFNLTTDVAWAWRVACNAVRSSSAGLRVFCQGNKLLELGVGTPAQIEVMVTKYTTITVVGLFTDPLPVQVTGEATTTNAVRQFYQYVELVQQ